MIRLDKLIISLITFSLIGLLSSFIIPKYSDELKIEELSEKWSKNELTEKQYINEYLELTTIKYEIQNLFIGLITFLLIILAFIKKKRVLKIKDILLVKSIKKNKLYFLLINIGILLLLFGFLETLIKEDYQYPIYDNSAQAIFGLFFLALILIPITNLFFVIFLIQPRKKNTLLNIEFRSLGSFLNGIILLILSLILLGSLVAFIIHGSILGVIASQILIYISISILSEINYKTVPNSK